MNLVWVQTRILLAFYHHMDTFFELFGLITMYPIQWQIVYELRAAVCTWKSDNNLRLSISDLWVTIFRNQKPHHMQLIVFTAARKSWLAWFDKLSCGKNTTLQLLQWLVHCSISIPLQGGDDTHRLQYCRRSSFSASLREFRSLRYCRRCDAVGY